MTDEHYQAVNRLEDPGSLTLDEIRKAVTGLAFGLVEGTLQYDMIWATDVLPKIDAALASLVRPIAPTFKWQPISTFVPEDHVDEKVLIWGKHGIISAIFLPGEWDHNLVEDEFLGPVWSCHDGDIEIEIEQEFTESGGSIYHHGEVKFWCPMPASPEMI